MAHQESETTVTGYHAQKDDIVRRPSYLNGRVTETIMEGGEQAQAKVSETSQAIARLIRA
ncbi:hypothetical protein GCM10017771_88830 [Streptomyces capitiformicae]|uniref:Uncharacterized protein n=1 Tax=Streptomyces capitiformicae TaxID=2014920 RepID=A0A918ZRL2_9ACTN|nr:hypothetical protein GCM10017771_88830 [Streptomyces capitiformicae]